MLQEVAIFWNACKWWDERKNWFCESTIAGPREMETQVPAGSYRNEQPMASDGNAKSQHRKAEGGGLVLNTARFRARDLAKLDEAQGVAGGTPHSGRVTRHTYIS